MFACFVANISARSNRPLMNHNQLKLCSVVLLFYFRFLSFSLLTHRYYWVTMTHSRNMWTHWIHLFDFYLDVAFLLTIPMVLMSQCFDAVSDLNRLILLDSFIFDSPVFFLSSFFYTFLALDGLWWWHAHTSTHSDLVESCRWLVEIIYWLCSFPKERIIYLFSFL